MNVFTDTIIMMAPASCGHETSKLWIQLIKQAILGTIWRLRTAGHEAQSYILSSKHNDFPLTIMMFSALGSTISVIITALVNLVHGM